MKDNKSALRSIKNTILQIDKSISIYSGRLQFPASETLISPLGLPFYGPIWALSLKPSK